LASRKRAFSRSCTRKDYAGDNRKAGLESESMPTLPENCGAIERLRKEPPAHSAIVDLDEMGPVSAKSYPGQEAINISPRSAQRAKQEIDSGRRAKGSVYGALWETTRDCWTQCYPRWCKAYCIDFLCFVDEQIPAEVKRIYTIMENLQMHHCHDLLYSFRKGVMC
jgi:hypothetical protein